MNWAWATSIEQLWRSPSFPIWLTLAAAGFFGIILLVTLLRAEKSVANGALAVIALLAIAVAVAATLRGFGSGPDAGGGYAVRTANSASPSSSVVAMPALACIDDLADETVLTACEKALFGSPEAVAAAVSYASARLARLTALGDAAANRTMTPEFDSLRRSIERDRYGLIAYVLAARDRCQSNDCAAFRSLTDHNQISANMDRRVYEATVQRHAASWGELSSAPTLAGLPPAVPTGKPTTADFPTANSIPPVNIMTETPVAAAPAAPKPSTAAAAAPAAAKPSAALPTPLPSAANAQAAQTAGQAPAAAKKPAAPKHRPVAPVQLAPAAASPDND